MTDHEERTTRLWQSTGQNAVYERLAAMVAAGQEGVLATVVATRASVPRHAGSKMIVHPDGSVTGTIGGGTAEALVIASAGEVLADGECRLVPVDLAGEHGVCGGTMEIFLEPVLQATPFVVVGAGHVGQALVALGRTLSFRFTVVDDRPEFLAGVGATPGVTTILAGPAEVAARLEMPRRGAVLVCSRNHELDAGYLEALLRLESTAGRRFVFFGSLGSAAKARKLRRAVGANEELCERLAQVRLPVGIEIGAETPAEIALSVLAEAQATLRGVRPVIGADGSAAWRSRGGGL